jgi:tetratricopeptide (TPR) repeat protein
MTEHPPPADFVRFAHGTLAARDKHRLLTHLLRRCPHCCLALARLGGFETPGAPPGEVSAEDYDGAIDRAYAAASRIAGRRYEAMATVAALLAGEGAATGHSTTGLRLLQDLPRLRALLEAARALRHEDPQGMLRFAKLARCAADQLRMRELGRQSVADLRALAWSELATAYRVMNELDQAEKAMQCAVHWCQRGSRSEILLARVGSLLASLLAYQRRFSEGRELLAIVYRIHTGAGNQHLAGRTLVKQGTFCLWEGSPRQAIPLLRRGLELLDKDRDPELIVQTIWNMVWGLTDLGHYRSARRQLWRARPLIAGVIHPHRLRWLEGRIFAGLSDFSRAAAAFQQARAGFVEQGQVYPAALVGLDLAALWAGQGRVQEVFELADEMIVTFRALRIAREAIATLLVLKRACRYGGQLLQLIETARDLLEHLERQPARPRYSGSPPSPGAPPSSPSS